jgi:hypothetical protein
MATLAYLDTTSIPDRKVGVYMICNLGGRHNTYGVCSEHLSGLWSEHLQQIMCSHNTYTSCVVRRPTLNYV